MADTIQEALLELQQAIEDAIPGVNTLDELARVIDRLTDQQTVAIGSALVALTEFQLDKISDGISNAANSIVQNVESTANRINSQTIQSEINIRNSVLQTSQMTWDRLDTIEQNMGDFTEGLATMTESLVESFEDNVDELATRLVESIQAKEDAIVQQIQDSFESIFDNIESITGSIEASADKIDAAIDDSAEMISEATNKQTAVLDKRLEDITDMLEDEIRAGSQRISASLNAQTAALVGAEAASTTAMVAALGAIATAISTTGGAQAASTTAINTTIAGVVAAVTAWIASNALGEDFTIEKFLGEIMSEIMQAQYKVTQKAYEDFDKDVQ